MKFKLKIIIQQYKFQIEKSNNNNFYQAQTIVIMEVTNKVKKNININNIIRIHLVINMIQTLLLMVVQKAAVKIIYSVILLINSNNLGTQAIIIKILLIIKFYKRLNNHSNQTFQPLKIELKDLKEVQVHTQIIYPIIIFLIIYHPPETFRFQLLHYIFHPKNQIINIPILLVINIRVIYQI